MSGTDPALRRVERVAETVAHEVDREGDHYDHESGEGDEPPEAEALALPVGDQLAERGIRRLNPEAQERERRFDEDRGGNDQRRVDDDRPDDVRKHVTR